MTYETQTVTDQHAAANSEIWEVILRTVFPGGLTVPDGDAHRKLLEDYCGGQLTIEAVSRFFASPPAGWNLPLVTVEKRREQLVDEICELLQDPTGRRMSEHDLRQARIKYQSTYSLGQLRARLVELMLKQAWAQKSVPEIRSELAAMRGSNPWAPYEQLPEIIEGLPKQSYLRWAAKQEFTRFRYFVTRYGVDQVNAAMTSR